MYRMRCTRSGKRLVTWIGAFLLISLVWCQVYWSQERSLASRQSENIKRATKQKVTNNIYKSFNAELPKTRLNINPELRQKFVSRLYNGRIQQEKLTKNGNSLKSNFDDDNSESTRNIWETDTTKSRNNDLFSNEKAAELNEDGTVYNETAFMKVLHKQKSGVTKSPIRDFKQVRIKVYDESGMHVLKYEEYKKWKYQSFVRDVANPFPKSKTPPKVVPYDNDIPRPNPRMLIKDLSTEIDDFGIQIETGKDKARRLRIGDDDILKMPDIQVILEETKSSPYKIPNLVHFIWFGCRRFMVHNYMSILSVYEYHIPDLIIFHTNCEPNGTYWEALKTTIDSRMKIVKRSPPTSIWGHTVKKVEHQSDVARLEILLEVGGIYMDDDVVVLKSLDSLRVEEMVLGEENYDALANSVIMADPGSWFLRKWFSYYRDFNDTKWSESSCFVPWSLWNLFPSALRVVKEKMLRPNWEEIKFIYHELWDWRENFSVHLYSRFMLAVDGTPERSLQELSVLNTTYGEIARYVIWQSSQIRDITEWMV